MKLLLDANLSPRLVDLLRDGISDIVHVFDIEGIAGDDRLIWEQALAQDMTIVSKDSDFNTLSLLRGAPPEVVWLRVGNSSTRRIAELLRRGYDRLLACADDPDATRLVIGGRP